MIKNATLQLVCCNEGTGDWRAGPVYNHLRTILEINVHQPYSQIKLSHFKAIDEITWQCFDCFHFNRRALQLHFLRQDLRIMAFDLACAVGSHSKDFEIKNR
jgi:hypothetical protein